MTVALIVAHDEDRLIGREGTIPWHDRQRYSHLADLTRADLKRFRELTTGHAVIMGRRTWASLGKPLPRRQNIVLTRDHTFTAEGIEVAHSLDEALTRAGTGRTRFIIGGGEIYRLALPIAGLIYRTVIHERFGRPHDAANVHFPALDESEWEVTEAQPVQRATFETLVRRAGTH